MSSRKFTNLYCGVYYCRNSSINQPGLSFFSIPKDPERAAQWLKLIHRETESSQSIAQNIRVCEIHFAAPMIARNNSRNRLCREAVPIFHLPGEDDVATGVSQYTQTDLTYLSLCLSGNVFQVGVSTKPRAQKKKEQEELKKQQYDPLKEYANDSTDEESLDIKQETPDDAENSDDYESERGGPATEKIYLKSISLKQEPIKDGPTKSKRARLEHAEDANYTDELYEFAKYVAEQLMCLDEEDARIAQAEIIAVLSKFNTNKIMRCLSEPSTSNQQTKIDHCVTEVAPTLSQVNPIISSEAKNSRSKFNTSRPLVTKSCSQANTAGPSETQSCSPVYITGPLEPQPGCVLGSSLKQFAVLNVNSGASSMVPVRYVVVPAAIGTGVNLKPQLRNTEGTLITQSGSGPFVESRVTQSETSHVTCAQTSVTEPGSSSMMFSDTLVKIEPDFGSSHSIHLTLPSEEDSESVSIKFEPNSEDET